MLNEDGGIETDLTVVCLGENNYRIITAAANREHDKFYIKNTCQKMLNYMMLQMNIVCLVYLGQKVEI